MADRFKRLFTFLKSRQFLIHLGSAFVSFFLLAWLTVFFLNSYTGHGDDNKISVPNLVGVSSDELAGILEPKGLEFEIVDSVFSDDQPKGSVLSQNPRPTDSTRQYVKEGRKIYVTVVAKSPKMIAMPALVNTSKRHAEGLARIIGLKVKYKYRPYPDCKDCVIDQQVNGKTIEPGERIPSGTLVTLILGEGTGGEKQPVPDLIGKTIDQANSSLGSVTLGLFVAGCEGCETKKDSSAAKIIRQVPGPGSVASSGSDVNVWLSAKEFELGGSTNDDPLDD